MEDDDASALTGHQVHTLLSLVRHRMRGDGSCWVYAILACLGLLEHDHHKHDLDPTPRDRGMDALCRLMASVWFDMNKGALNMSDGEMAEFVTTIDAVPEYPLESQEDMGSFGNMTTIMCLASYFGLNIICWNKKTLRIPDALQQCIKIQHDVSQDCAAHFQTIHIK